MTQEQFNEKYKQYIPEGWYGLGFDIPEVTIYLDEVMQDLITIPEFELHQIKLKFGMARFYFGSKWNSAHLETAIRFSIEDKINTLIKNNHNAKTNNP
jgi:hypothetical protein